MHDRKIHVGLSSVPLSKQGNRLKFQLEPEGTNPPRMNEIINTIPINLTRQLALLPSGNSVHSAMVCIFDDPGVNNYVLLITLLVLNQKKSIIS